MCLGRPFIKRLAAASPARAGLSASVHAGDLDDLRRAVELRSFGHPLAFRYG